MAHSTERRSILFLDAYDSFSNNITSLLATLLEVKVFVLPIDSVQFIQNGVVDDDALKAELTRYDAVVCGPGPGSPDKAADVGLTGKIWELEDEHVVPALGVCLGFQSLALSCGAQIRRLRRGLHGMVRQIERRPTASVCGERVGGNIFADVGDFKATLYHSLCADLGQDAVTSENWHEKRWQAPPSCPSIIPLAWIDEQREDEKAERISLAIKHKARPFWGLQYHPESVCTEPEGHKVLINWFAAAVKWNETHGRLIDRTTTKVARNALRPCLLARAFPMAQKLPPIAGRYRSRRIRLAPGLDVPEIARRFQSEGAESVILDSANAKTKLSAEAADVRGRYSILAIDAQACDRLEYHAGDQHVTICNPRREAGRPGVERIPLQTSENVWHVIARYHAMKRQNLREHEDLPFLGGFMGYVTYEQGLHALSIPLSPHRNHRRPDISLVWVTKSIVVDHRNDVIHFQDLNASADSRWLEEAAGKLETPTTRILNRRLAEELRQGEIAARRRRYSHSTATKAWVNITKPRSVDYKAKVRRCQDFIAAGETYELCLTDQTTIGRSIESSFPAVPGDALCGTYGNRCLNHSRVRRMSSHTPSKCKMTDVDASSAWRLYLALRNRNPAPFASYLRLGGATLVSSSPERFLKYSQTGLCTMKPMKGTVKKTLAVATLQQAEDLLRVPKEQAENLMIVDLVRHDLHSVCGPGNVTVPDLMKVEDYGSVFQMSTVVQGQLPATDDEHGRYTGLDVLAASLPPGSMTGAPKKRSCETLQRIEGIDHERSLYSGVVGYMCVSGKGDWAVTIRSAFRWDDETREDELGVMQEKWHIGAGGAVTILSTPEGETEEMFTKLARPLSVFADGV